jgi:hypothetical protein
MWNESEGSLDRLTLAVVSMLVESPGDEAIDEEVWSHLCTSDSDDLVLNAAAIFKKGTIELTSFLKYRLRTLRR